MLTNASIFLTLGKLALYIAGILRQFSARQRAMVKIFSCFLQLKSTTPNSKISKSAAQRAVAGVIACGRQPALYLSCGVPDTQEGRFETIALVAFLLFYRLRRIDKAGAGKLGQCLSQAIYDRLFWNFEASLREAGVGDAAIGKLMRAMVDVFANRMVAYDRGVKDEQALLSSLRRIFYANLDPMPEQLTLLAGYFHRAAAAVDRQSDRTVLQGQVEWPNFIATKSF